MQTGLSTSSCVPMTPSSPNTHSPTSSSPSWTPSSPCSSRRRLPKSQIQYVYNIKDITDQLSNNVTDSLVRFQCLALLSTVSNTQSRCGKLCAQTRQKAERNSIFGSARKLLLQSETKSLEATEYAQMIRLLFCNDHKQSRPMEKWNKFLVDSWKVADKPDKLKLLAALRQAFPEEPSKPKSRKTSPAPATFSRSNQPSPVGQLSPSSRDTPQHDSTAQYISPPSTAASASDDSLVCESPPIQSAKRNQRKHRRSRSGKPASKNSKFSNASRATSESSSDATAVDSETPQDDDNNTQASLIDVELHKLMEKPFSTEGSVYIFRAPKFFNERLGMKESIVKIGRTKDIKERKAKLKKNCKMNDIQLVTDTDNESHRCYDRLELLVHHELQNFLRKFICPGCGAKHQEWFAVPEKVALDSVQRWRRFILAEPYDEDGSLSKYWKDMLRNKYERPGLEKRDDHDTRNERWNRWLDEAIKNKPPAPMQERQMRIIELQKAKQESEKYQADLAITKDILRRAEARLEEQEKEHLNAQNIKDETIGLLKDDVKHYKGHHEKRLSSLSATGADPMISKPGLVS